MYFRGALKGWTVTWNDVVCQDLGETGPNSHSQMASLHRSTYCMDDGAIAITQME